MTSLASSNPKSEIRYIRVDRIEANPFQPRQTFSEEELEKLAESLREHGMLQPVLVRPKREHWFMIIAGERRWRAADRAGLKTIPCIVREVDDLTAQKLADEENENRVDITDLDRALQLQRLWETWEAEGKHPSFRSVAAYLNKDKSWVSARLKALDFHSDVIEMLGRNQAVLTIAKEINAVANADRRAHYIRLVDAGESRGTVLEVMAQDKQQDEEHAATLRRQKEASTPPDKFTAQAQKQYAQTGHGTTHTRSMVPLTSDNATTARGQVADAIAKLKTWVQHLPKDEKVRALESLREFVEGQN